MGSEWKENLPEFHFVILGLSREVVIKFRKIGITGKQCLIRHLEYPEFQTRIIGRKESARLPRLRSRRAMARTIPPKKAENAD